MIRMDWERPKADPSPCPQGPRPIRGRRSHPDNKTLVTQPNRVKNITWETKRRSLTSNWVFTDHLHDVVPRINMCCRHGVAADPYDGELPYRSAPALVVL
ncbi:hypothetical protein Tco_1262036 [Tanacetum coccineum]